MLKLLKRVVRVRIIHRLRVVERLLPVDTCMSLLIEFSSGRRLLRHGEGRVDGKAISHSESSFNRLLNGGSWLSRNRQVLESYYGIPKSWLASVNLRG